MKLRKLTFATLLASASLFSHAYANQANMFAVDATTATTGIVYLQSNEFSSLLDLTSGGNAFNYAVVYFTPAETDNYTFGQAQAPVDTVMILYQGVFDSSNPEVGALALNDDVESVHHGQFVDPSTVQCGQNSDWCPQVRAAVTQGQVYSIVISTYFPGTSLGQPLNMQFYASGLGNFSSSPLLVSEEQIATELQLQAALQGITLSNVQSRTIANQLRHRMAAPEATDPSYLTAFTTEVGENPAAKIFKQITANGSILSNGRWTAWSETNADGMRNRSNSDINGYDASQQFGLDYRFANGWIGGASIGLSKFENDLGENGSLKGSAFWVSPYLGLNFDTWLLSLQGTYTYSDYANFDSGIGVSTGGHGHRFSASASLLRTFDIGGNFSLTPELTVAIGRESISNVDALSSTQMADPSFFSSRLGGELAYKLPDDSRVYGLAYAEYTNTNATRDQSYLTQGFEGQDWSATLGAGYEASVAESVTLGLEARVRGLGSETLIYGGSAKLSVKF